MFELVALGVTLGSAIVGYFAARRFVSERLRYVDAVQRPLVPVAIGIGAAIVATPIVWLLPLVGTGTAIIFGASVGVGVAAGRRAIQRADYRLGSGS